MTAGKRIMALLLCFVMAVSMMPVSAVAEETEESEHVHFYEAEVTEPTCTESGYTTYTCECGDSYIDDYTEPLNHPETVVIPGTEATCTEPGLTDGLQCAVCGEVLQEQQEIPPVGHVPEYHAEIPATETSTGLTEGSVCAVCGEVLEGLEEIPMIEPEPEEESAQEPEPDLIQEPAPEQEAEPEPELDQESEAEAAVDQEEAFDQSEQSGTEEGLTDVPDDVSNDGETAEGQNLTVEGEEPAEPVEQPDEFLEEDEAEEEEAEEANEGEGTAEDLPESNPEESETEESGEIQESAKPVTVLFQLVPETAEVRLYTKNEQGEEQTVAAEADGSYLLLPGEYCYTVSAEGYIITEEKVLTVEPSDLPLMIPVTLEKKTEGLVTVKFVVSPEADVLIRVYTRDEQGTEENVEPEKDGSFLLKPGTYWYTAEAEGFETVEETALEVTGSESALDIPLTLKQAELTLDFLNQEWHEIPFELIEDPADNETALEGFIAEALYGDVVPEGMGPGLAKKNFGATLKGNDARVYKALKKLFSSVANGNRSSTVFSIPLSTIVGKSLVTQSEYYDSSTFDFDFSKVIGMLVADTPYEQYWFDKYDQSIYGYTEGNASWSGSKIDVSKLYFVYVFPVTAECASGTTTNGIYSGVRTSIGSSVSAAVSNAKSIVSRASYYSDTDKLRYYAEQICNLTSYNYGAVDNPTPYGNPWQLIWVFDGDSSTNVVCEGYARSFQYLCDLTNFDRNIACYCLIGHWYGPYNDGGHAWNAVTMDNGENYIVDVTHSDDGSTGRFNNAVFMLTADSGNPTDGYYVTRKDGVQVFYGYSSQFGSYMFSTESARTITIGRTYIASPILNKASNTDSGIKITWSAVSGAEKYRVYRKSGSGSWKALGETGSTSYIDKTAKVRTKYTYTVRALSGSNSSGYDKKGLTITRMYTAPKLSGVTNVNGGVKITWSAGKGAAKYRVFRKAAGESSWTKLGVTSGKSYTDKKVSTGKKYSYTVRSLNSAGNYVSGNASAKSITYIAAPMLKGLGNVNGGVEIRWSKVSGAVKYRVFRKAAGQGSWKKIGDTSAVKYTDKTAVSGTKYAYTVRCISQSGNSYTSGYNSAGKAITYIAAPVISSVANTKNGVKITWKKSNGAAKYRVFRKGPGDSNWVSLKNTTALSYTDTAVKKGVKYTYTVRCISKDGKSYTSGYNTVGKSITYKPQTVAAPKITAQPKAASVMAGTKVKFTVAASGSGLQYQWQYRKNTGESWTNSKANGCNKAALTFSTKSAMNGYQYRCRIKNDGGTVYSKAVTLKVYTESGWGLPRRVPANATITRRSYSYRETTESSSSSLSGWTSNGRVWRQTGSGSAYYASFPSGYDTNDRYYNGYMHGPYSSYTTDSSMRQVSNYQDGYIYWHWMYNVRYASNTTRAISSKKGTYGSGKFWYGYFYAMASTTDCPYLSNGYCNSQNLPSYNAKSVIDSFASSSDKSSSTSGLGTNRFFRFPRYVSVYTDYTAVYSYYRDLKYQPNDPGNGSNISNKVMYVKYRING